MRVYLSGGIHGVGNAGDRFLAGSRVLTGLHHEPVSPLDITACEHGSCAHGLVGKDVRNGHTWACWLKYDLMAMLDCEAIAMLPNWEASPGARLENSVATSVGLRRVWLNESLFLRELEKIVKQRRVES